MTKLSEIDAAIREQVRMRQDAEKRGDAVAVVCAVAKENRLKGDRAKVLREAE